MDLGASVISTIDICIKYGTLLRQRIKAYQVANERIDELCIRVDGVTIKTEELIASLKQYIPSLRPEFQEHYAAVLLKLQTKLKSAKGTLEDFRPPDLHESVNRSQIKVSLRRSEKTKFSVLESTLEQHLSDLEKWYTQFESSWKLLILDPGFGSVKRSPFQAPAVSTVEHIRQAVLEARSAIHKSAVLKDASILAGGFWPIEGSSCIMSSLHSTSPLQEVIIEQTAYPQTTSRDLALTYVYQLAHLLGNCQPESLGLLRCLGMIPNAQDQFQIIYAKPPESSPIGLRGLLSDAAIPLEGRFLLATSLARSIMSVHTASIVHKSIRPENLLIFFDATTNNPQAYLVGFESFRPAAAVTSRSSDMLWERNLYRHPQRQGLLPDDIYPYIMQHDIYSLGVVLLEIGLWLSFVRYSEKTHEAKPHELLQIKEDIDESNKQQSAVNIKKRLIDLADEELPSKMGSKYAEVVVSCLKCLDRGGSFLEEGDDQKDADGVVIGVRFVEKVLGKLETISI